MRDVDILSTRTRWLAVATGAVASGLFFIGLGSFSPLLLIGAVLPHRHSRLGRWLAWLGAAGLSELLAIEDILLLRQPLPYHDNMVHLVLYWLLASTVLVLWLDVELIAEALMRLRRSRLLTQRDTRALSWSEWIFITVLNLWIALGVYGGVKGHSGSESFYPLGMDLAWALVVAASDFVILMSWLRRSASTHDP